MSSGEGVSDSAPQPPTTIVEVGPEDSGRIDHFLAERVGLSRSRVAALIAEGRVWVDGKVPRKSHRVAIGERVAIEIPEPVALDAKPQDIPVDLLYEDAHLVVVDKPAGLVVHPAPGHPDGTLVNALLHHVRDLAGIGGRLRPGIVHRLDRDTSGLMVVAKSDAAHQRLSDALRKRAVTRLYTALTWGHLSEEETVVDAPIGRHPKDRKRMAVIPGGRPATTRIRVVERWPAADLLNVALDTGRTHQIRVHLLHLGHPVVGDNTYGIGWERGMSGGSRGWAAELVRRVTRQFLHARELSFRHPVSGEAMRFQSPLPPDLATVVRWARREADDSPGLN